MSFEPLYKGHLLTMATLFIPWMAVIDRYFILQWIWTKNERYNRRHIEITVFSNVLYTMSEARHVI